MAQGVSKERLPYPVELGSVYGRLENIRSVISDLIRGREFDLDLLTCVEFKQSGEVTMVHLNKVLTQICSDLCDVYARRSQGDQECMI